MQRAQNTGNCVQDTKIATLQLIDIYLQQKNRNVIIKVWALLKSLQSQSSFSQRGNGHSQENDNQYSIQIQSEKLEPISLEENQEKRDNPRPFKYISQTPKNNPYKLTLRNQSSQLSFFRVKTKNSGRMKTMGYEIEQEMREKLPTQISQEEGEEREQFPEEGGSEDGSGDRSEEGNQFENLILKKLEKIQASMKKLKENRKKKNDEFCYQDQIKEELEKQNLETPRISKATENKQEAEEEQIICNQIPELKGLEDIQMKDSSKGMRPHYKSQTDRRRTASRDETSLKQYKTIKNNHYQEESQSITNGISICSQKIGPSDILVYVPGIGYCLPISTRDLPTSVPLIHHTHSSYSNSSSSSVKKHYRHISANPFMDEPVQ